MVWFGILQHMEDLLTDSHHGFRANHSCETQLLTLLDELLQEVAKGSSTT